MLSLPQVAESGMEFGSALPGVWTKDFTNPTNTSAAYFAGKKYVRHTQPLNHAMPRTSSWSACRFQAVRMPFLWERLQPVLGLPVTFDPLYLGLIDQYVANVTGQGMHIGERVARQELHIRPGLWIL